MEQPRCATCLWYEPDGPNFGRCMVKPPVIQVVLPPPTAIGGQPKPLVQGLRPPTGRDDRCAKHTPAKQMALGRTAMLP